MTRANPLVLFGEACRLGALCLLALMLPSAKAAADSAKDVAKEQPIELPKFVVTDSRMLPQPESWRYATLPNFEILSSASDRATKRLVNDFQMFREALDVVWPLPAKLNTPVSLILCGKARQFESFEPADVGGDNMMAHASLYLKGPTRSAIVIDMGSSVVNVMALDIDLDFQNGTDSGRISIDHNRQLYREYVHYLLSRAEPRLPIWFEEGMAQIIMAMDFNPKWIEFGKIEEANTVSPAAAVAAMNRQLGNDTDSSDAPDTSMFGNEPAEDRDFNAALARRALLPMDKMFAVSRDAPEVKNPLGNNTWAKQCYAFVHMCLYGENKKWQKPFAEFLLRSTQEPVTEDLFKQCFKMSYKDMGIQLRGYIQSPMYQEMIYKAKDGKSFLATTHIELRDATQAEVGRIKGQAMLLAGRTDNARTELITPYMRGERDPQLLASLGMIEHSAGKEDRARKFLEAAAAGGATDADALRQLAKLRYDEAIAAPAGPNHRFSKAQEDGIVSLLLVARKQPPPVMSTYELLANALAQSPEKPTRSDVMPLIEGAQLFPGRLRLVYTAAALCADAGVMDAAHALTAHGLKYAPDNVTKAGFQQLAASLPPAPAPVAQPGAAVPPAAPAGGK